MSARFPRSVVHFPDCGPSWRIDREIAANLAAEGDLANVIYVTSNSGMLDLLTCEDKALYDDWQLAPMIAAPIVLDSEIIGAIMAYGISKLMIEKYGHPGLDFKAQHTEIIESKPFIEAVPSREGASH